MARIFYPTSEPLRFLLDSIHRREVALPDFQRNFVWNPRQTVELIESILRNYPAGSLLRIRNEKKNTFEPRAVAGAPALDGYSPSYLMLDGQQRLTSLYQALYGKGDHRYFLNLCRLLDGDDLDDCVFYMPKDRAEKRYSAIESQATGLIFPLEILFSPSAPFKSFGRWLDRVIEQCDRDVDVSKEDLKEELRERIEDIWIENIKSYEFPVVTLKEETEPEAICTIFETLNRTGVKLSVFDLLAARYWKDVRLRDLWKTAKDNHPIIENFKVEPYYTLQAIALFTAKAASCKRGDVLKMEVGQILEGWGPVVRGMAKMLKMLRDDCGVVLPRWLPYNPILIPASAAFARHENTKGPQKGAIRVKMKRWFWCSVFGQTYESAANSQAAKDFGQLIEWFAGGQEPESVRDFGSRFRSEDLRETARRQSARYRGCIALILSGQARDFHSGKPITASMVRGKEIEDHHVFPKAHLDSSAPEVPEEQRNCVLNRTLIDRETNRWIGKKAPADYLGEIETELGAESLNEVLESHLLPGGADSSLRENRFEDFLKDRQERFARRIEEVTK